MKIEENHSFTVEEAQQRLKILVDNWEKKHGLKVAWNGPTASVAGKVMGVTIQANVRVEAKRIVAEGADPGLLYRTAAVGYLKKKFSEYFDPKVTAADLAQRTS